MIWPSARPALGQIRQLLVGHSPPALVHHLLDLHEFGMNSLRSQNTYCFDRQQPKTQHADRKADPKRRLTLGGELHRRSAAPRIERAHASCAKL